MTDHDADVCLILEGTYPYVSGGVSTWTHDLILNQPDKTFHIVAMLAPGSDPKQAYEMPKNVTGITRVFLQEMPHEKAISDKSALQDFYAHVEGALLNIQTHAKLMHIKTIMKALKKLPQQAGAKTVLNSFNAWGMLVRMNRTSMAHTCFLDYFWSWRALMGGLFSILLSPLPKAKCYHALSTGYAGLYLTRASIETGRPCVITEHGIYTNERRIEILLADWLSDQHALNFNIEKEYMERTLQDFWIDTFRGYSKMTYECAEQIITLYEGNYEFQIADGADPKKLRVIPNGIDYEAYSAIKRDEDHPPTIALIGRVVLIKDVKTFIRAIAILKDKVPGIKAYLMGPTDEDKEYYEECLSMQKSLGVEDVLEFTGKVSLTDYLGKIDIIVLTSLSEAQPLVILEAGAAGVISVATNVGSCSELVMGKNDEEPHLGAGGAICPLANPGAIARAIADLFNNPEQMVRARKAIQERTKKYYNRIDQHAAYRDLYDKMMVK